LTNYPHLRIRHKEELRLLGGHLWAFSNELLDLPRDLAPGSVVTLVRERDGSPIGNGFYHPNSLIAFRMLTRDSGEALNEAFLEKRIRESASRRDLLRKQRNAVRLVHGESDLLPGLIVDIFDNVIGYQITSAGFEVRKETVVRILQKIFNPVSIVEKNNSHLRKLEGLPMGEQLVFGNDSIAEIHDAAGTRFAVDVLTGQKTGFYLDQMENRTRLRDFIRPGSRVCDLFSNAGGFAMNAALSGAASVIAVDESVTALGHVKRNAELNAVQDIITTIEANCFDYIRESRDEMDVIVLDPPALAKSKKDIAQARKAYLTLNTQAMRLLAADGILVSCSCSHHIDSYEMLGIIREAGWRAKRTVTLLERRGAGIDHPILAAMPETEYLKVFILSIR
jgi:23S rRNA (cytosine1962-C5)-methyltransferase